MMTEQQAKIALNDLVNSESYKSLSSEAKQQALFNLSKDISIDASGSKTVFYTGKIDGRSANSIVEEMIKKGDDIRVINKTDAALFLNSKEFKKALYETAGIDWNSYLRGTLSANELNIIKNLNDTKLYHPTEGFWAEASRRFAKATKGEVIALIGTGLDDKIDIGRTFGAVELPELLKNLDITSINNMSIDDIRNNYNNDIKKIFDALYVRSSGIFSASKGNYSKVLNLNNNGFKNSEFINKFKELSKDIRQELENIDNILESCKKINKSEHTSSLETTEINEKNNVKGENRLILYFEFYENSLRF
jgi:hypothetical protein